MITDLFSVAQQKEFVYTQQLKHLILQLKLFLFRRIALLNVIKHRLSTGVKSKTDVMLINATLLTFGLKTTLQLHQYEQHIGPSNKKEKLYGTAPDQEENKVGLSHIFISTIMLSLETKPHPRCYLDTHFNTFIFITHQW